MYTQLSKDKTQFRLVVRTQQHAVSNLPPEVVLFLPVFS